MDRQQPTNMVTVTKGGVTIARELTQKEWDLTARTYAKDLNRYYNDRPIGGPGSRTIVTNAVAQSLAQNQYSGDQQRKTP